MYNLLIVERERKVMQVDAQNNLARDATQKNESLQIIKIRNVMHHHVSNKYKKKEG